MKKILSLICCIALSACGQQYIQHQPNMNAINPALTIERTIRSQPPAYTTVPYEISVTQDCIQMRLKEQRHKRVDDVSKTICYENIGRIDLYKTRIYYDVEIYDRVNNWMYAVYSFEESNAKDFIDALHTMMKR